MAAPTYVNYIETSWSTNTSPKTTGSFDVLTNDVLVVVGKINYNFDWATAILNTPSGGSLTYNLQKSYNVENADSPPVYIWTATVDSNKSMTVSITRSGTGSMPFGFSVFVFRNATIGASAITGGGAAGSPTLNITTTQSNSAIVVINSDFNSITSTVTWRTNAGALTQKTSYQDTSNYENCTYVGYHADSGSINTYAVGLTSPSGQLYTLGAIEIKEAAPASASSIPPNILSNYHRLFSHLLAR